MFLKIIITICLLISKQSLLTEANDECALNTECKPIQECQAVRNNFYLIRRIPYCNLDQRGTHVCCLLPQPKYTQDKDDSFRAVRECKSYQSLNRSCEKPLIVSGKKADPKEYPFMALVYYKEGDTNQWLCGGTLISNRYVLTAAHCFVVEHPPNMVRLGELDYSTTTDDASPIDFVIQNYITHPQYVTTEILTKYNDIALVQLESVVKFNDYIMPACLPLVDGREFQEYLAAGWGRTGDAREYSSHLLKVKLDRFDDSTCIEKVKVTHYLEQGINNRTQMCAGSFSDNRDTCSGDSGGPLFVDHPDYKCLFLVLGITSYGDGGCANVGHPSVYTRITLYLDWIEQIVWNEPARLSYG